MTASVHDADSLQKALDGSAGVPPRIAPITYVALLGSVALGAALAFGLGGRDVAARLLSQAYSR